MRVPNALQERVSLKVLTAAAKRAVRQSRALESGLEREFYELLTELNLGGEFAPQRSIPTELALDRVQVAEPLRQGVSQIRGHACTAVEGTSESCGAPARFARAATLPRVATPLASRRDPGARCRDLHDPALSTPNGTGARSRT